MWGKRSGKESKCWKFGKRRPERATEGHKWDRAERPQMKQQDLECWWFLWGRVTISQTAAISPAYIHSPGERGLQYSGFSMTYFKHFNEWICFIGKTWDLCLYIMVSREPSFESKGEQNLKFILQYPINGIVLSPCGSTAKLHQEIHSLKKRQNKIVTVMYSSRSL